jgi:hypothetical protein
MAKLQINQLCKIIYSKGYRQSYGTPLFQRHCKIRKFASGKPFNILVELKGKVFTIVPYGNLVPVGDKPSKPKNQPVTAKETLT